MALPQNAVPAISQFHETSLLQQLHLLAESLRDLHLNETGDEAQHLLPSMARSSLDVLSEAASSLELQRRLVRGRQARESGGAVKDLDGVARRVHVLEKATLLAEGVRADGTDPALLSPIVADGVRGRTVQRCGSRREVDGGEDVGPAAQSFAG